MGWTAYRLVYQAKSPIHIGWHTLGYIKLTRYYITGKAMWGAMTANIARIMNLDKPLQDHYKDIGNTLMNKYIFASYFYPALDHKKPLHPCFTDRGLIYGSLHTPDPSQEGNYTLDKFERLFIKSYGQTAVMPDTNTAEDETLHESEFISSMVYEKDEQKPVYFVGYVFINDETKYDNSPIKWKNIKGAVSEIFVGADRKYGWGRLLLDEGKTGEVTDSMVFGNTLYSDDKDLKIEIKKGDLIPAHLSISSDIKMKGDIEPLVGREWGEVTDKDGKTHKGFGQMVSKAEICWVPGSIIEEENPLTFRIGAYGILE
ncbi:hypothetical protein C4544_03255 [candidate division WS5 bacterium]|uniref:Uncharacterized protein n=1 Tax=candidate division WS5 bacterium TaxID=2093353 RepID=A0A419DDY3_9BACT|nr:MAG: hypothetical protein C4544_03255 [candidate division WS5 bacterium]